MMEFDWDPIKAGKNVLKHGVSFRDASSVFADPLAVVRSHPEHSVNEDRSIIIGSATTETLLVVVFVERGEIIRIVRARAATAQERRNYEKKKDRRG